MRIARVAGIPVYVSGWWLLLVAWVMLSYAGTAAASVPALSTGTSYLVAGSFAVLLFGSVFLHELGHALTSVRFGIDVRSITLWMLGGYTEMEREAPTPGQEFTVAAAGPAVSLLLGGVGVVAEVLFAPGGVPHELAFQFAASNLLVGVFNLLPGLPLDGGRLLRSAVWKITRDPLRGTTAAGWAGRGVAVAVMLFAVIGIQNDDGAALNVLFTLAIALFLWSGASQAIRAGQLGRQVGSLNLAELTRPALLVPGDLPLAEALRRAAEADLTSVVVVGEGLRPVGVVSDQSVAAVPLQRRPWIPVSSVARTLHDGLILPVTLSGEELLRAVRASPATEYVAVDGDPLRGGRVMGVIRTADIAATLDQRKTTR
jgi:Zn-dependent protease/CBS domain-containing protein